MKTHEKTVLVKFKIIYAVAIIMVTAGHCSGGGIDLTFAGLFPYGGIHLALFVFVSGYFFDQDNTHSFAKYLAKKTKKLIIPCYLYNFAYAIIVVISKKLGFTMRGSPSFSSLILLPIIDGHQFTYNMGSWFIIPLFCIQIGSYIVNIVISRIFRKKENLRGLALFVFFLILGIISNTLACKGFATKNFKYLFFIRIGYFLPMYGLGILYKSILEKNEKKISNTVYFTVLFLCKLLLVWYYGKSMGYTASWCGDFVDGPFMPIIVAFLGIALWIRIATILEDVLKNSRIMNSLADNTYSIMMNQFLGFMAVKAIYAILSRYTHFCQNFDMQKFKTDIWYCYTPKGLSQLRIFYLVAGLATPILIQFFIDNLKKILIPYYRKLITHIRRAPQKRRKKNRNC